MAQKRAPTATLSHTAVQKPYHSYSRIDDWLNLDQEAFVKHCQALYEALATETLRVNEVALGKATNRIYKADKHEQEMFTSKCVWYTTLKL